MRKVDLIRKNLVQSVKNERNILAMANNPFVVGSPCCTLAWCGEEVTGHMLPSLLHRLNLRY